MAEPAQGGATQRVRQRVGVEVVALLEEEASPQATSRRSCCRSRQSGLARSLLHGCSRCPLAIALRAAAAGDARVLTALEHRLWRSLPERFEAMRTLASRAARHLFCPCGCRSEPRRLHHAGLRSRERRHQRTRARGRSAPPGATDGFGSPPGRQPPRHPRATLRRPRSKRPFSSCSIWCRARETEEVVRRRPNLVDHVRAWAVVLGEVLPSSVSWHVDITVFRPRRRWGTTSRQRDPCADPGRSRCAGGLAQRSGADYYTDVAFKITVEAAEEVVELGDGGLTDWTTLPDTKATPRSAASSPASPRNV